MTQSQPLSESDVEAFLQKLKAAETDKKVDQIQFFGLKLEEASSLPPTTIDGLTLSISPLLRSPHHLLITSIISSFLPFFLPHLPTAAPASNLRLALHQLLPSLLEKLNDPKERIHSSASSCIAILGQKCYEAEIPSSSPALHAGTNGTGNGFGIGNGNGHGNGNGNGNGNFGLGISVKGKEKEGLVGYWERSIKETMTAKGWRGKVEAMKMLLTMRSEMGPKLPLKPWIAPLVDLLEDGDNHVRDQARETVVALLSPSSTPPAARSELKKLLAARNVRKTIADSIITRVFSGGAESGRSTPALDAQSQTKEGTDGAGPPKSGTVTPAGDDVSVVFIASSRDLENEFANMLPSFVDKETEQNWAPREKALIRIRGMLRGQAHQQFPEAFVSGLKGGMMEGITKTLLSLRTTVAQQACAVTLELAERLGSALDPFVENVLPTLGKMAGFTKKLIAERSQRSLTAVIIHTTCHPRIYISHIASGVSEKNIQTRHFSTGHLRTFLDIHGTRSKHSIETTPGLLDQLESSLRKGLADVNPSVRDLARAAFWSFHGIWPARGNTILGSLDGAARKQLEKANSHDSSGVVAPVPTRPGPAPAKKVSSTMSALLAEKRKAKAAEIAASKVAQESPRIVSGPIPNSPSVQQGLPRSSSSSSIAPRSKTAPPSQPNSDADVSPSRDRRSPNATIRPSAAAQQTTPRAANKSALESPSERGQVARVARSPESSTSSIGSPSRTKSPLRQSTTTLSRVRSPTASSATSGVQALRTPTLQRKPLPSFSADRGLGSMPSPNEPASTQRAHTDRRDPSRAAPPSPSPGIVQEGLRAQAEQAESAARQLLDFDDGLSSDPQNVNVPITPARPPRASIRGTTNGAGAGPGPGGNLLSTPANQGIARQPWEDSPRNMAITPKMLSNLKNRKSEKTWWLRQQQLMEQATPLKSAGPSPASAIDDDVSALLAGQPELRNLQKLALFSTSHPIEIPEDADEEDIAEARQVWEDNRLFVRIFEGLVAYLDASKPADMLLQALVVLWELIQHQWPMFDDLEDPILDALFRLRSCNSIPVLESTNALISLLAETSDPLFLLSILRRGLASYLLLHPVEEVAEAEASAQVQVLLGEAARASGYLFGLNGLGMCILRLPSEVVVVESKHLEPVVMDALASPTVSTRQAAQTLLLAIQCVLIDAHRTLSLFPRLATGQKDLAMYLMDKNGLILHAAQSQGVDPAEEEERKERVVGEMVGLMARGLPK